MEARGWQEFQRGIYWRQSHPDHNDYVYLSNLGTTLLDVIVELLNRERAHADLSHSLEEGMADVRRMLEECETVDPDLIELPSGDFVSLRDVRMVVPRAEGNGVKIYYHSAGHAVYETKYFADEIVLRDKLRQRAGSKITTLPETTGTIDFTATGMVGDGDNDNETWHVNGSLPPDAVAGIEKKIDELEGGEAQRLRKALDKLAREADAYQKYHNEKFYAIPLGPHEGLNPAIREARDVLEKTARAERKMGCGS